MLLLTVVKKKKCFFAPIYVVLESSDFCTQIFYLVYAELFIFNTDDFKNLLLFL